MCIGTYPWMRCSHRMQSSTCPRQKVRGRSFTYQMVMSMTGRSWNWYFLFNECQMRCSHRMQSSTSPWHKVSGSYSTYQMVMSMTGRSCVLVLLFDECQMRCSHQMQSSTCPRQKVRGRSLTYQMVMSMTGRSWNWYLSMTNVKWDVPIECKVVLVPNIKWEDVPWHTKRWCPWLEGHEIGTFSRRMSNEMFPSNAK
jgi:hypothetical protein